MEFTTKIFLNMECLQVVTSRLQHVENISSLWKPLKTDYSFQKPVNYSFLDGLQVFL